MSKAATYLHFDASGYGCGSGFTPDGTIPAGCLPCSATQAENPQAWQEVNGAVVARPTTLAELQAQQIDVIKLGYASAVVQPVPFTTAAGITASFQADQASQSILSLSLQRARVAGGVPTGFYWKAADNTKPAFTMADLEGLDAAMFTQGWVAFQHKDTQIDAINAITDPNPANPSAATIEAIKAIA